MCDKNIFKQQIYVNIIRDSYLGLSCVTGNCIELGVRTRVRPGSDY